MHWWNYNGAGHGWFGFGWLFGFLFWVLVVLAIVYLIKILFGGNRQPHTKESPEEILKRRYAAGEITTEEFEEIKKRLSS